MTGWDGDNAFGALGDEKRKDPDGGRESEEDVTLS